MKIVVSLDASVILAACLGSALDAKSVAAQGVFQALGEHRIRASVVDSVESELETSIRNRVGEVIEALRTIAQDPPSSDREEDPRALERLFAKLRRSAPNSAGALLALESRMTGALKDFAPTTPDRWGALVRQLVIEATSLLAEVQRRKDSLALEVIASPKNTNLEKFRGVVPTSDLVHIASLDALASNRQVNVLFVTLDAALHGARDEILARSPRVIVTTPAHLESQLSGLSAPR